jgi:hypothetical protein
MTTYQQAWKEHEIAWSKFEHVRNDKNVSEAQFHAAKAAYAVATAKFDAAFEAEAKKTK